MTDTALIAVYVGSILLLSLSYIAFSVVYGQGMNTTSGPFINDTERGNQSQAVRWVTNDDPILQIKMDYPSNWGKREFRDGFRFLPLNQSYSYETDLRIEKEPLFPSTDTPEKYMREVLNEERQYGIKIIIMNETTVNNYPAYVVQYKLGDTEIRVDYFIVDTDDFTGYHIRYSTDRPEDYLHYLPDVGRMINSFQITK
jgi:hypothetical protein